MNIFYLDKNPRACAEMHLDKHVVKMIIEYAQLMSTAHRLLDGVPYVDKTANGRSIKRWRLEGENETIMMKASHINHPSAVWVRQSKQNYIWLHQMWFYLCKEYTYRYGKIHAVEKRMANALYLYPKNIPNSVFSEPTPAMPDIYKVKNDSITSYHQYYAGAKNTFAKWTRRSVPEWYQSLLHSNV
jgi:hypothetical protein